MWFISSKVSSIIEMFLWKMLNIHFYSFENV
jgi:hypothetical protein